MWFLPAWSLFLEFPSENHPRCLTSSDRCMVTKGGPSSSGCCPKQKRGHVLVLSQTSCTSCWERQFGACLLPIPPRSHKRGLGAGILPSSKMKSCTAVLGLSPCVEISLFWAQCVLLCFAEVCAIDGTRPTAVLDLFPAGREWSASLTA